MKFPSLAALAVAVALGATACLALWRASAQPTPSPRPVPSPYGAAGAAVEVGQPYPGNIGPFSGAGVPGYGPVHLSPAAAKEADKQRAQEVEAEREVRTLLKEYASTEKEGEKAKIKEKVSAALAKQFDAQRKRRELELEHLEEQLKKMRELMKKRNDARDSIIEKRLDQLLREAEGLGWPAPPGPIAPQALPGPRTSSAFGAPAGR